jgi:hypothetical protein
MFRRPRRVLLALAAIAAVAIPLTLTASHSWGGYHWGRTQNPFTVKLGDNVSTQWDSYLGTTSSDWSKSTVLDTAIVAGGSTKKTCSASSGRVEVCNGKYGYNGWLGVARIWISGQHITQGTVRVNDSYFNSATYNTPAWRNLVMCQEVGHTFGLDHQDENFDNPNLGTCMDYTSNPTTNQHPNQHDYDELVIIYSHLDSTTTVDQTAQLPSAMTEPAFDNQSEWGRLVSESRDHGKSVYELDFGGGKKIYTFVTWTLEERGRRAAAARHLD